MKLTTKLAVFLMVTGALATSTVACGGGKTVSRTNVSATNTSWATNFQTPTPQPAYYEPPPPFTGDLNGYHIDVAYQGRSPFDVCPEVGLAPPPPGQTVAVVAAPGPLRIDEARLPKSLSATSLPEAFLCRGALAQVMWSLHIAPGTPNANVGGGSVFISRIKGSEPLQHGAQKSQWSAATVAGLPAVLASPGGIGDCFVAVYRPETDVLTTVQATGADGAFCTQLAEAVLAGG